MRLWLVQMSGGMEVGATSLILGLPNFVVISIVLQKIESLKVKCEFSQTFGKLLILNSTWNTLILTREKYVEAYEEWWEQECCWAMQ